MSRANVVTSGKKERAHNLRSDTTLPADKQAEQIMAIYPIIEGQKATAEHSEPTFAPAAKPSSNDSITKAEGDDSLIDFGDNANDATAKPEADNLPAKTPDEIEKLLTTTGKPAEGPLIDFAQDVRSSLPNSPDKANAPS